MFKWAKLGKSNVCVVDWSPLALEKLNYFVVSQKNTVRVADLLVTLLLRLETAGVNLQSVTLVGHSLGAQIMGKVGGNLNKNKSSFQRAIGTIIGLDPAGPCYTFPCAVEPNKILDRDDATYVQVIHTNALFLGTASPAGCHDFVVNSGVLQLPLFIIGSHYFATDLFAYTLDPSVNCLGRTFWLSPQKQRLGIYNQKNPTTCGTYLLFALPLPFYPYYC